MADFDFSLEPAYTPPSGSAADFDFSTGAAATESDAVAAGVGTALGESSFLGDPYWAQVRLLLHFDGTAGDTSTVDSSTYAHAITFGTGELSTGAKFGATRLAGQVSSPTLTTALSAAFTIEGFVYWDAGTSDFYPIFLASDDGSGDAWTIAAAGSALSLQTYDGGTDTLTTVITGAVPADNVYHHIAWQRSGTTHSLFLDGALLGTATFSENLVNPSLSAGAGDAERVDEVRVTDGTARYTAPFTPPTEAFYDAGIPASTAEADGAASGASAAAALASSTAGAALGTTGTGSALGQLGNAVPGGWSQADLFPTGGWTFASLVDATATVGPSPTGFGYDLRLRGYEGKATGRWYFEVTVNHVSGSTSATNYFGVTRTTTALADISGAGVGTYLSTTDGATYGFAFDADTRRSWIRAPGGWITGDPGIGGDPEGTLLPVGTYQPFGMVRGTASTTRRQIVGRFVTEDLLYGAPAGFAAIYDVPGEAAGTAGGTSAAAAQGMATAASGMGEASGLATPAVSGLAGALGTASAAGAAALAAPALAASVGEGGAAGASTAAGTLRTEAAGSGTTQGAATVDGRAVLEGTASASGSATLVGNGATRKAVPSGITARETVIELVARSTARGLVGRETPQTSAARTTDAPITARTDEVSTI